MRPSLSPRRNPPSRSSPRRVHATTHGGVRHSAPRRRKAAGAEAGCGGGAWWIWSLSRGEELAPAAAPGARHGRSGEAGVDGGGEKGKEPAREIPDKEPASSGFRALVSSPCFLRRHRALHRDPGALLGVFTFSLSHDGAGGDGTGFHPTEPPHPAAPRLLDRAAPPRPRRVRDRAGHRLHRARRLRPAVPPLRPAPAHPEDLAGTVDGVLNVFGGRRACEPFLAPAEPCEPDAEWPPCS